MTVDQYGERAGLVRKAINLFTFLSRAQQLLVKPIRTADKFDRVTWFSDLPAHPAVRSSLGLLDLEMDAPLVVVQRVPKLEPPLVPDELAVPEDRLVTPFDSLFEQRIFNRILDRGYTVIPQYSAIGYEIDLVIVGAKGRLAVECDGDFWHGPAQYEGDLARQRELERCGWRFFRIRESTFYADMASTLKLLWDMLDELDIHPSEWIDPSVGAEETTAVEDLIDEIYDEADAQIDRPPTDIGPPPEQFSGVGRYENS